MFVTLEQSPDPTESADQAASKKSSSAKLHFRPYQLEAFNNRTNGIECWVWGRQTGKSFTLAAWAVDRLLTRPGRLVTILSNSLLNGIELNKKCAAICDSMKQIYVQENQSGTASFELMSLETRVRVLGKESRIKILPANPRTARGFSGDLILDEFAFHENSEAIWESVEPILSANRDFLCRIASSPNGRHNVFYRLVSGGSIPVRLVSRSIAWEQGLKIFHPITRELINPAQARALATNLKSYDQSYECSFESENMPLLSYEIIANAEEFKTGIVAEGIWPPELLADLALSEGPLYLGVDVGRSRDLTVLTVIEKKKNTLHVRAILRLSNMSLPEQQKRLEQISSITGFRSASIDRTGLGLGLFEYSRVKLGSRVEGIDFASRVPIDSAIALHAQNSGRIRVPEALALQVLRVFEDRRIHIPANAELREDLRKPERITCSNGEVRIAASRDNSGHADHFWSIALAINAALGRKPAHAETTSINKYPTIPKRSYL
jgi:phage FluMu gp28-like protein